MAYWDTLFDRFQSAQSVRRNALEQKEALVQAKRNFDEWVQKVISPLFSDIQAHAETKAKLFYERTGERIDVHPFK